MSRQEEILTYRASNLRRFSATISGCWLVLASCLLCSNLFAQAAPVPADLNLASLRIKALDALYEFDLSPDQLRIVRAAATGAASSQTRTSVKPNAELSKALKGFQTAILSHEDDEAISKQRNHVIELLAAADLDDEVQPTGEAIAKAPAVVRELKASQIAAFMALHADEVGDPEELILGALEPIRESRADAAAGTAGAANEANSLTAEAAANATFLVCGNEPAKAKPMAQQIYNWLKAQADLSDTEFAAGEAQRPEAAKRIVGDIDPLVVLNHWLDLRLAEIISNPELPAAIDAMMAAPAKPK